MWPAWACCRAWVKRLPSNWPVEIIRSLRKIKENLANERFDQHLQGTRRMPGAAGRGFTRPPIDGLIRRANAQGIAAENADQDSKRPARPPGTGAGRPVRGQRERRDPAGYQAFAHRALEPDAPEGADRNPDGAADRQRPAAGRADPGDDRLLHPHQRVAKAHAGLLPALGKRFAGEVRRFHHHRRAGRADALRGRLLLEGTDRLSSTGPRPMSTRPSAFAGGPRPRSTIFTVCPSINSTPSCSASSSTAS